MANTINFQFNYPYLGYDEQNRRKYGYYWSESRVILNGSYTYPMIFNNAVPGVKRLKVYCEIENTGSGTVFNRSWDFMVYRENSGWVDVHTFTMPDTGIYTVDCEVPNYNITRFACVPSSNPGASRTWTSWFEVKLMTITQQLTTVDTEETQYMCGLYTKMGSLYTEPAEVYVNIGGQPIKATEVYINVDGTLKQLPHMEYGYQISTVPETMKVFEFTPSISGKYKILVDNKSGDNEIRLFNSDMLQMHDGYFYNSEFDLTAGETYYIMLMHYYYNTATSESDLKIYII